MSQISVSHLTFAYDGSFDNIFEDVSFVLDSDWKLGFTGRNGRGKSTFLRLLAGELKSGGSISSELRFDLFPFPAAAPDMTAFEVAERDCPGLELWRLQRELSLLGFDLDALWRSFGTFSSGEQTKLGLAALFLREGGFPLIDEPTNHLDVAGRRLLGAYLKSKRGFILVSHDRNLLDACCDHILSINRNNIEIQKGNFSSWYENKQASDRFEQAENRKLVQEVRRLSEAARQASGWSDNLEATKIGTGACDRGYIGAKSAKMMKRAKVIERRREEALAEKSKLLKNLEPIRTLSLSPIPYRANLLASVRNFAAVYGGRTCASVSFEIERGDRIALVGPNGSGKSSVLKALVSRSVALGFSAEPPPFEGEIFVGNGLTVSYVPQITEGLAGPLSEYAGERGLDEPLFFALLRKLDFARVQFEKDLSSLSEGQKKKVLIAASLCSRANLYVWDEPLNFIDVFSRIQLENMLKECGATLLFVEHDETFVSKIANKQTTFY